MTVNGTDISHWNEHPIIEPYDFVILKCTQGDYQVDSAYHERVNLVRNNGRILGHYHFVDVGINVERQMRKFSDNVDSLPGDIIALDFEDEGHWRLYNKQHIANVGTECMNFLINTYQDCRVLLYCNRSTYTGIVTAFGVPLGDGLWIASPGVEPAWPWVLWQYGNGSVDYDRAIFTDVTAMKRWLHRTPQSTKFSQKFLLLNG